MCTSSTNSVENFVTVVCSSDSGIISALDCNYDNSTEAENCGMEHRKRSIIRGWSLTLSPATAIHVLAVKLTP